MADQRIYPDDLADRLKASAGQPYRPSNGTEGEIFAEAWCAGCSRRNGFAGRGCAIMLNALGYDISDPSYPSEWQYGADGQPTCTGFRDMTVRARVARCGRTADLFGGEVSHG